MKVRDTHREKVIEVLRWIVIALGISMVTGRVASFSRFPHCSSETTRIVQAAALNSASS